MDRELHRYELDIDQVMVEAATYLRDRGYSPSQQDDGRVWIFETHWGRGAAYSEIGGLLYTMTGKLLREVREDHPDD